MSCRLVLLSFLSLAMCQYDETLGKEGWYLCSVSYCLQQKIEAWNCGHICNLAPQVTEVTVFKNSSGYDAGYAGFNAARNAIVVVFRGTLPWLIKNWIQDIDYIKVPFPDCDGCQVHEGFYHAYLQLQSQVLTVVKALKNKHLFSKMFVTGHSLGAALAHHALIDLIRNGYTIDYFYNYGSPRVGDDKFKTFIQNLWRNFKGRITRGNDPVPHLPLSAQGFSHSSNEVYYMKHLLKPDTFKVCNDEVTEDNSCSNSNFIDLSVTDHCHYYDLDQLIYVPPCQIS